MEHDDEVKGKGNSYTTKFRQYDVRIGRWLSLDPKMSKYPFSSPFVAFHNNPIYWTDPLGDDPPTDDPPARKTAPKHFWSKKNFVATSDKNTIVHDYKGGKIDKLYNEAWAKLESSGAGVGDYKLSNGQTWTINTSGKFYPSGGEGTMTLTRFEVKRLSEFKNTLGKHGAEHAFKNMAKYGLSQKPGYLIEGSFHKAISILAKENNVSTANLAGIFKDHLPLSAVPSEMKSQAKTKFGSKSFNYVKWGKASLLVVAVAADVYEVYNAEDKMREVVIKAGAWASAAAGAAYGATVGSAVPGFGTIIGGALGGIGGYIAGEMVTELIHDWTFTLLK